MTAMADPGVDGVMATPDILDDLALLGALDGKVTLDENADFRHPDHEALVDNSATDPLELAATEKERN